MKDWIAPIIVAIIMSVPAFLSWKTSTATKKALAERSASDLARDQLELVYGQAYDRAQRINQEIVQGLREEITRLQGELTGVRVEMTSTAHRNLELERLVNTLERSVSRMSAMLAQYGVDMPADLPHPGAAS